MKRSHFQNEMKKRSKPVIALCSFWRTQLFINTDKKKTKTTGSWIAQTLESLDQDTFVTLFSSVQISNFYLHTERLVSVFFFFGFAVSLARARSESGWFIFVCHTKFECLERGRVGWAAGVHRLLSVDFWFFVRFAWTLIALANDFLFFCFSQYFMFQLTYKKITATWIRINITNRIKTRSIHHKSLIDFF